MPWSSTMAKPARRKLAPSASAIRGKGWASDTTLTATGIGAYIAENTAKGDFPRIALGICVMCIFVMLFNRQIWRRLYRFAEERWRID